MPGRELRFIVVIGLLLVGAVLYSLISPAPSSGGPRWPATDQVFAVDGWTINPQRVDSANGAVFVSRAYGGPGGSTAMLTIVTSQNAKVLAAGADVPFLGNGYQVAPAPSSIVPPLAGRQALLATRGNEQWLLLYASGEQRGLLGRGPLAWAMAVVDGLLGRSNDYYRLYLMTPMHGQDTSGVRNTVDLAAVLFPRIAAWYGAA